MIYQYKASLCTTAFAICSLSFAGISSAHANDDFEFSGFARVIAGVTTDDVRYNGYDNSVSFAQESLLGLRADYSLSDDIHIVGQAIARSNQTRESEIQWLYLDYRPLPQLLFKIGRQRLPIFQYSEVIDVGFAYPWISLPIEIYAPYLFSEFDGIFASYEFSNKLFSGSVDAYYGGFDGDVTVAETSSEADIDDLTGIVLQANRDQFTFRVSHLTGNADVEIAELAPFQQALSQLGFARSAATFDINELARYTQVSGGWENVENFARFEFASYNSDAFLVPSSNSYWVSVGRNFYPFTAHITFAENKITFGEPIREIPIGVDPQLDFVAQQFDSIIASISLKDMQSLTLGLRYDLNASMALKADVKFIEGQEVPEDGLINPQLSVNEDTQLLQVAWEWVF